MKEKSLLLPVVAAAAFSWTTIMIGLYWWGLKKEKEELYNLANQQAKSFFQEIVTTRSWNAKHGGVYVPVTDETQPNPYLKDPARDVVTVTGLKLTKINPAFMTRQIGEIAAQKNMVIFHITSATPIRPGNSPDPWEMMAIEKFKNGLDEILELKEGPSGERRFRYMAPLWVEKNCLKCHAAQGYAEGDLRGGISVTIDAEAMLSSQRSTFSNMTIAYGCIWVLGLFGIFGGHRLLKKQEKARFRVIRELGQTEEALRKERDKLRAALDEVRHLSGLLPICANCKKIRDDKGYWNRIEKYICDHSEAQFSHSICPDCAKKLYPELK